MQRPLRADLGTSWLRSPEGTRSALWPGDLETTVGGKANRALLVLLKENTRNLVSSLSPVR